MSLNRNINDKQTLKKHWNSILPKLLLNVSHMTYKHIVSDLADYYSSTLNKILYIANQV